MKNPAIVSTTCFAFVATVWMVACAPINASRIGSGGDEESDTVVDQDSDAETDATVEQDTNQESSDEETEHEDSASQDEVDSEEEAGESVDEDGDGVALPFDCDDTDDSVHPYAVELCDGIDNDCDGKVDDAQDNVWYLDADGDGYGSNDPGDKLENGCTPGVQFLVENKGDCDDQDPDIHPGMPEVCDGVDNDCDSDVDEEGAQGAKLWYPDVDDDGFGDANTPVEQVVTACKPEPDTVDNNNDCNDQAVNVHPGADEFCDKLDNNCDGETDEGITNTVYLDADGDGYGDPFESKSTCLEEDEFVDNQADCDDTDSEVHVGAPELCNGFDDDCDGVVDEPLVGGICNDDNPFTTDTCVNGECEYEEVMVQFKCSVPSGYENEYTCRSIFFFEYGPGGEYGELIKQQTNGVLEHPLQEICLNFVLDGILHVNTYVITPFDPYAEWEGGEDTKVFVQGKLIKGIPGTVTLWEAIDTIYDSKDFEDTCEF